MARILLFSSHVSHGYVGNAGLTFLLQRLGHEVISLPSVLLSNHKGYPHFAGTKFLPSQLRPIMESLDFNEVLYDIDAVVTGFLASPEQAFFADELVSTVKTHSPEALYLCDPVGGDKDSGLYVDELTFEAITMKLVPQADIVTPNLYEFLTMTKADAVDEAYVRQYMAKADQPTELLITSWAEKNDRIQTLLATHGELTRADAPLVDNIPKGTGDLMAGFYLSARLKGLSPKEALDLANRQMEIIIAASKDRKELKLIQTQDQWSAEMKVFSA